jgi:large subunit ribosomal protein L17
VRLGDNAEMCLMELVDFNETYKQEGAEKKGKTRRGRGKKAAEGASAEAGAEAPKAEEKPKAKKESSDKKKK